MKRDLKIVVVDYGVGNHESVINALRFLKCPHEISGEEQVVLQSDALILPGVGAFGEAMKNLERRHLIEPLCEAVLKRSTPILGICLGMQIMADSSTEGGLHEGLHWIPGKVECLDRKIYNHVPHVGWNNLQVKKREPLFDKTENSHSFYFDHSYQFNTSLDYQSATCTYHKGEITAAVQRDHIFGVQFHPEKSQISGLKLFRSFLTFLASRHKTDAYA